MFLSHLHSVDPPEITKDLESQSATTGTNTTFTIEATGDELQFQWQKDDIDIDSSEPRLQCNSVGKASTLHIKDTKKSDKGRYKCLLKNPVEKKGKVSHEAKLTVCKLLDYNLMQQLLFTANIVLPNLQGVTTNKS